MTKISVCLTHYNRAEKLAPTLESLACQTRVPDEVFVWDDASPNDPTDVVMRFKDRFPRFVYNRNVSNLGMPGNLNAVLSQATGDYVANLHDADVFDPLLLEKWADALDSNPSAGMVFCGMRVTGKNSANSKDVILDIPAFMRGRDFFSSRLVGNLSCPIWGTTMVRKSVHEALLPFDSQFRNWADIDYWMRVCRDYDIAYVPEPLIILDDSDTPERRFSWFRLFIVHHMYIVNIRRHFSGDKIALRNAIQTQCSFLRKKYFVLMYRNLRNWDMHAFRKGFLYFSRIFSARLHEDTFQLMRDVDPHR